MASKKEAVFSCSQCSVEVLKWQGQCPGCSEWNTLKVIVSRQPKPKDGQYRQPVPMNTIQLTEDETLLSGYPELDDVLGQGFVRGSVILFGGEPGVGKSTLSMQIGQKMAALGHTILYVSTEESEKQVARRAKRLGNCSDQLHVLAETNIEHILYSMKELKPDVVVLDSIQMAYQHEASGAVGSVSQVRTSATAIIECIKQMNMVGIITSHVTKEGGIAGPKMLEHLVDVVLYFEGDRTQRYRMLRCFKNRYAPTDEIAVWLMEAKGLVSAQRISELFIGDMTSVAGSVVIPTRQGSRAILVELQALVVNSGYGMAKRTFLGVDSNRATLMMAMLEKQLDIKLHANDVILNIVGGLKITEPALDLGIVVAMLSSYYNVPMRDRIGVIGEMGLNGEIRAVSIIEKRVKELENMGFSYCIIPKANQEQCLKSDRVHYIVFDHVLELSDWIKTGQVQPIPIASSI